VLQVLLFKDNIFYLKIISLFCFYILFVFKETVSQSFLQRSCFEVFLFGKIYRESNGELVMICRSYTKFVWLASNIIIVFVSIFYYHLRELYIAVNEEHFGVPCLSRCSAAVLCLVVTRFWVNAKRTVMFSFIQNSVISAGYNYVCL